MTPEYQTLQLLGPANAVPDLLTVQDEIVSCDVSSMRDLVLHVTQVVDDGTVTLLVQYTLDGVYWATHATLSEASFAAAAGDVEVVPLSNAATVPMPIPAKAVRVKSSALSSSTAQYAVSVRGKRLPQ